MHMCITIATFLPYLYITSSTTVRMWTGYPFIQEESSLKNENQGDENQDAFHPGNDPNNYTP